MPIIIDPYLEITYRKGKPLAAYLYLSAASGVKSVRTESRDTGLLVDFGPDDQPIGLESTAPEQMTAAQINLFGYRQLSATCIKGVI